MVSFRGTKTWVLRTIPHSHGNWILRTHPPHPPHPPHPHSLIEWSQGQLVALPSGPSNHFCDTFGHLPLIGGLNVFGACPFCCITVDSISTPPPPSTPTSHPIPHLPPQPTRCQASLLPELTYSGQTLGNPPNLREAPASRVRLGGAERERLSLGPEEVPGPSNYPSKREFANHHFGVRLYFSGSCEGPGANFQKERFDITHHSRCKQLFSSLHFWRAQEFGTLHNGFSCPWVFL